MEKVKLYHGSNTIVRIPDLSMSREDIDFGVGFYLSKDMVTSAKWACRKATAICNDYELSLDGLKVHTFSLDKDWLDFVIRNRNLTGEYSPFDDYDVLIGAIADDKLFHTLELYSDGYISAENAIKIMNCMDFGVQYVLKTDKAIRNLEHKGHIKIIGSEKDKFKQLYRNDCAEATKRTETLLKQLNGRG